MTLPGFDNRIFRFLTALLALAALASCVPMKGVAPSEAKPGEAVPPSIEAAPIKKLSPEEQEDMALMILEGILDIIAEGKREESIDVIEHGYKTIVEEFPDAKLAEDTLVRLIALNLKDRMPPNIEEAERLRGEFLKRYPYSPAKIVIEDELLRAYYKWGHWQKVLDATKPAVREYLKTRRLNGPFHMFLFSEAKMNSGDTVEAEKGYKIVIQMFPGSVEAGIAEKRISELREKKK